MLSRKPALGHRADDGARPRLDPAEFFIIVPNLCGNGLSSPSNTPPPFDGPSFPDVALYDNVVCPHRLVTERLGLDRLRLVLGFSMGAQQAVQWGALHPDMVDAIAPHLRLRRRRRG